VIESVPVGLDPAPAPPVGLGLPDGDMPDPAAAAPTLADAPDAGSREALNERCAEWLARLARGDADALVPLYHATLPRLWGLAHKVLGRDSDTEDVLSEVYTQVWRDARRFDTARGSALAWLAIICRSRAIDCLRRREPAGVVDANELGPGFDVDDDGGACPAACAEDPMSRLARAQVHRDLDGALARLGPVERQLVVLAYYRDLSQSELARMLGLPLGTVKSRTRRALAELRSLLITGDP